MNREGRFGHESYPRVDLEGLHGHSYGLGHGHDRDGGHGHDGGYDDEDGVELEDILIPWGLELLEKEESSIQQMRNQHHLQKAAAEVARRPL